jgi:hypothetical protein
MTLVGNVPHCTIFDHYLQSVSQEFRLNQQPSQMSLCMV